MSIQRVQVPRRHRSADELTIPGPVPGELTQERKHDARQSVATILALVAAGRGEIGNHDLVLTRLDQVARQARALGALLEEPALPPTAGTAVDVCAEVSATVAALSAGYEGTVRLVGGADASAMFSPTSLRRVLTNVVRNAMRAAGRRGLVQVTVVSHSDGVVLEVEDDGPGFGALPVINGIGLRSSRRLVQRQGGRLDIGTGRLGGALVRVTLPPSVLQESGRP